VGVCVCACARVCTVCVNCEAIRPARIYSLL